MNNWGRLNKNFVYVCLFINNPSLSLSFRLVYKQAEPKQKNLFMNKLMSYKAWYKTILA